jgi:deoxyribodipyrimidine photo-lyase
MWLGSYLVHWRRVQWQTGARWFLQHLLDGDPASNNLSWQWLASSFSSKPYIFNRANLERFSSGRYCRSCQAAAAGTCPFEASYEALQEQLFAPQAPAPSGGASGNAPPNASANDSPWRAIPAHSASSSSSSSHASRQPLLWIHHEALGPANPALRAHPGRPALFVLDAASLSANRLRFLQECAAELPLQQRRGVVAEELLSVAHAEGADAIVTSRAVDPRIATIAAELDARQRHAPPARRLPLIALDPDPFVELEEPVDLGRFSRYWRRAERRVWAQWGQEPN